MENNHLHAQRNPGAGHQKQINGPAKKTQKKNQPPVKSRKTAKKVADRKKANGDGEDQGVAARSRQNPQRANLDKQK